MKPESKPRTLDAILTDREKLLQHVAEKYGPTLAVRIAALNAAFEAWKEKGGNPDIFVTLDWRAFDSLFTFLAYQPPPALELPDDPVAMAEIWLASIHDDPHTAAIIRGLLSIVPTRKRKKARAALVEVPRLIPEFSAYGLMSTEEEE